MSLTPPRSLAEVVASEQEAKKQAPSIEAQQSALPYHIAYVLDGRVETVFHVEEKMAAILMSNPVVVQCAAPLDGGPQDGWRYNAETGTFTDPRA